MNPITFPECNTNFGPPPDLAESQCHTIPAYVGVVSGGSVDGSQIVVVAWHPLPWELKRLVEGGPIYISFMGGLPPHFPTTTFEEAIAPR